MNNIRLAILASGNGSTGEVLFDKASVVITNNPGAGIIEKAKAYRLPVEILLKADFKVTDSDFVDQRASQQSYGKALISLLKKYHVNFVSQNGWEAITPENVISEFKDRVVNAHPAPLDPGHSDFGGPGMYGLTVHQAVLNFAKRVNRPFSSEICLHLVTPELDKGELLAYAPVEVKPDDTPVTLQLRLKEEEKKLLKSFWNEVAKKGQLTLLKRTERVIQPGEEKLLEEAKKSAIAQNTQQ